MKVDTLAGMRTHSGEPPRSTAYYYADLERLKKKPAEEVKDQNELSEYVEANEVINDGAIREVPPLRDRQWSLPEYHTPEGRKIETYSTAGTFPMPETKEKEPLLAELEVVGRLPLTQLDSSPGVRRSRSWYLCCPNVGDEEISRESSWRYSSLRPVTAPPLPGQNGISTMVISQSSGRDDVASLRAERDSLARALAAERQRAATAARAHDARLAELHGVIAELVRRRAADKQSRAIPEEEVSDECESTTQPAGELDNDADQSRTEQIETSSLSPAELPTPQEPKVDQELPEDTTDTSTQEVDDRSGPPAEVPSPQECDTSLNLSERDSAPCLSSRCWQREDSGGSCERERGSPAAVYTTPPGCDSRQAKMAARVKLRRTEDTDSNNISEHTWCVEAAERLALDVCAQADLREALASARKDECVWRVRWLRAQAELGVARGALARAGDTARRLHCACAQLEAAAGARAAALAAADRALELYDVLLALAEAHHPDQRSSAEAVAWQLLQRLETDEVATIGEPLLSPGPWLRQRGAGGPESVSVAVSVPAGARWAETDERRLRAHAARLKALTVRLRTAACAPALFSYHDVDEEELPKATGVFNMAEMEAAVLMEEMLSARAASMTAGSRSKHSHDHDHKSESSRTRRRRERHWREAHASETDL